MKSAPDPASNRELGKSRVQTRQFASLVFIVQHKLQHGAVDFVAIHYKDALILHGA